MSAGMMELVFQYREFSFYQCDITESFVIERGTDSFKFRSCELLAFRKKIRDLLDSHLFESAAPDIEILYLPHCDRVLLLNIQDILQINELLSGALTLLELNSIIHRRLLRKISA